MRVLTLIPVLFGIPSFATVINRQFPHLLIPLKSSAPDTAFGTQPEGAVIHHAQSGDQQYMAISFDVPWNEAVICKLNFHLNTNDQKNAPTRLQGGPPWAVNISMIEPTINNDTISWNTRPKPLRHIALYDISTLRKVTAIQETWFECPKGGVAQFIMHPGTKMELEVGWYELDYPWSEGGPHGVTLEMHT